MDQNNCPKHPTKVFKTAIWNACFQWPWSSRNDEVTVPNPPPTWATVMVAFAVIGATPTDSKTGYSVKDAIPTIPVKIPANKLISTK